MAIDTAREVELGFAPYFSHKTLGDSEMMTTGEAMRFLNKNEAGAKSVAELVISVD